MVRPKTAWRTRTLLGAALVAAGAICLGACSTPTLPLPPPAALRSTPPDADGIITVEGEVLEGSYVFVLNETTERGVIVRADGTGHFVARIESVTLTDPDAEDYLTIWQRRGNDIGEQVNIPVPYP